MIKLLLGTSLTFGLMLSISTATMASPGDGLDRDAAGGSMMGRSLRSTQMMKHRRHHR